MVTFSNPAQGYTLQRPASWEQARPRTCSCRPCACTHDAGACEDCSWRSPHDAPPAPATQVDKAGADSLFQDPAKKSTSVGVTVYPVMISRLEEFGSLESVGDKLLGAGARPKAVCLARGASAQQQRAPSPAPAPPADTASCLRPPPPLLA